MANDEQPKRGRPARGKAKPMMIRLSDEMTADLDDLADERGIPPATIARQLLKERLDQLRRP